MASFPTPNLIINRLADVDLSSSQFKAVVLTTSGTVAVAGANAGAIGFLQNQPTAGQICEIAGYGGGAKGIAAASLNAGVLVKSNAIGDLVAATADTDVAIGVTLETSVDDDVFAVMPLLNHVSI